MTRHRHSILRELGADLQRLRRASADRGALARELARASVSRRAMLDPPPAGAPARLARWSADALSLAGAEVQTLLETAAVWLLVGVGYAAVAFGLVWLALFLLARWP